LFSLGFPTWLFELLLALNLAYHHTPAMNSNNIPHRNGKAPAREGVGLLWARASNLVLGLGIGLRIALPVALGVPVFASFAAGAERAAVPTASIWTVPEVGALPDDERGRLVRRGRDLITATYAHIGPEVPNPDNRYAGNNLACSNCHLEAGTKKFALPLFGLFGEFPRYSARLGDEISIEERVNSCMTRSMNGRSMPLGGAQMRAVVAYIKFLSSGVPPGQELPGLGAGKMPELTRAADPARGGPIYAAACAACHGPDGLGVRRSLPSVDLGYMMPPLWGRTASITEPAWRG